MRPLSVEKDPLMSSKTLLTSFFLLSLMPLLACSDGASGAGGANNDGGIDGAGPEKDGSGDKADGGTGDGSGDSEARDAGMASITLPDGTEVPVEEDGTVTLPDGTEFTVTDGGVFLLPNGDVATVSDFYGDAGVPDDLVDTGPPPMCGDHICSCANGLDDDGDGTIDGYDLQCVSSTDDDEASFATGISGDNRDDACQDCFFDGDSGSGNDGCRIPSSCLTDGDNSSGVGSCNSCEASAECTDFCQKYTPNGCDCFGCCEIQLGTDIDPAYILLDASCSLDDFGTCTECVQSDSCVNTCGDCELCPGKTVSELPLHCLIDPPGPTDPPAGDGGTTPPPPGTDGGDPTDPPPPDLPPYTCDFGEVCSDTLLCGADYQCILGCCTLVPI
jgi:hypothetical protein